MLKQVLWLKHPFVGGENVPSDKCETCVSLYIPVCLCSALRNEGRPTVNAMKLRLLVPLGVSFVRAAVLSIGDAGIEQRDLRILISGGLVQDGIHLTVKSSIEPVVYTTVTSTTTVRPLSLSMATHETSTYTQDPPSTSVRTSTSSSTRPSTSSSARTSTSISASSAPKPTEGWSAKGITYSPYSNSGSCNPAWKMEADIKKLQNFEVIRLYDTDCDCITNVLSALQPQQKLFLGIFYIDRIYDSVKVIKQSFNGDYSKVYAVSIGNEKVNDGTATPSDILGAIQRTRAALRDIGYTGPVVSVDTLVATESHPELCSYSDFIAVNSHPYWDGNVDPHECGPWLKEQVRRLADLCNNNKPILVTETGWPTRGQVFVNAVPSPANQRICLESLTHAIGDQILLFTPYNDYWKPPGPYGVEQFWGIFGDQ